MISHRSLARGLTRLKGEVRPDGLWIKPRWRLEAGTHRSGSMPLLKRHIGIFGLQAGEDVKRCGFGSGIFFLDASPVLCVGVIAEGRPPLLFSGMSEETADIDGWAVLGCGDEARMLRMLRAFLDAETGPGTMLVGHNLRGFDLPKLRLAYVRHRLRLPECLKPKLGDEERAKACDTMSLFKAFSMEHRDSLMVSLDVVAETLGIPRPKQHIDGAEIPKLHQTGQYDAILAYCAIDTMTCAKVYTLMAGLEGIT